MGPGEQMQIDSEHCRAICEEIGERLRIVLDREATELPPRLQALLLRLVAQDLAGSSSIAGAIEGTARHQLADTIGGPVLAA